MKRHRGRRRGWRETALSIEALEERLVFDTSGSWHTLAIAPDAFSSSDVAAFALTPTATLPTVNLVNNGGFESGVGTWWTTSGVTLSTTSSQSHSGSRAGRVSNRTQTWHGAYQTLSGSFTHGEQLAIAAWVKLENASASTANLTVRQVDGRGVTFTTIVTESVTNSVWRELRGTYHVNIVGTLQSLEVWIEGPGVGIPFLVDDVTVGRFDWEAAANARIDEYRKSHAQIRLVDQFGNALAGATIEVHQTSKSFAFGSALNHIGLNNQAYASFAEQAFNWATLEYEATWSSNEFTRDNENYYVADQMIAWARARGIQLRGHHLFWAQDAHGWADALADNELQAEMLERIEHALAHYAGDFRHWDVVNESLHGTYYTDRLGSDVVPWVYREAARVDPNVELFVNEYQILEGYLTDEYVAHIQWLQSRGARIDGIGVQAHLPGVVEPFTILSRLDELSSLNIPIWITEFDVADPDPEVRADQLEMFYRLAYSHPEVEGILLWDFWAGSAGRDPNRALMEVDGTINAAGRRLLDLMNEWSTHISATPAVNGLLDFRGYHGTYEVIVTLADGSRSTHAITLSDDVATHTFTFAYAVYPSVSFASAPSKAELGTAYRLNLSASNYIGAGSTGTFTYQIDWNNDGVFEQSVAGANNVSIDYVFSSPGTQTFKVRVQDSRGAVSPTIQKSIAVTGFQVVSSGSLKNLVWYGTFGADRVLFQDGGGGRVLVDVLQIDGSPVGVSQGFEGITGTILTYGQGGADQITTRSLNFIGITSTDENRGDEQLLAGARPGMDTNNSTATALAGVLVRHAARIDMAVPSEGIRPTWHLERAEFRLAPVEPEEAPSGSLWGVGEDVSAQTEVSVLDFAHARFESERSYGGASDGGDDSVPLEPTLIDELFQGVAVDVV